ncbi:MAG: tetratricopeptide repeat protein [Kofleriaceae bacterium]
MPRGAAPDRRGLLAPRRFPVGPADALERTIALPEPAACTDARLDAWPRVIPDAAVSERVTLEVAARELAQHRLEPVARAIAQVSALPVARDPFVLARLALLQGNHAIARHEVTAGLAKLVEAHTAARALGDAETTLDAGAALILATGLVRRDAQAVERWIATAVGDAERLARTAPDAAARTYLAAARVARELRELDEEGPIEASTASIVRGAGWVAKALMLVDETHVSWPRIEGLHLRGLFHAAAGRAADALADLAQATALARALYGPDHPVLAQLAGEPIVDLLALGRTDDAAAAERETTRILAIHGQASSLALARARIALGLGWIERGDLARRTALLVIARAQLPRSTERALLDNQVALALIADHRPAEALAPLREALALQQTAFDPAHPDLAITHYNLAVALRDRGQLGEALDHATRAATQFAARPTSNRHFLARALGAEIANRAGDHATALAWTKSAITENPTGDPEILAWPRLERARALLASGGDREEARRLLAQARMIWSSLERTQRVAEIDRLVRTSRLRPL